MNAVERVKLICKNQKIPISKLESDLGFGNAYISGLKKGVLPNDRLELIAKYLGVSIDYLATGKDHNIGSFSEQEDLIIKIRNDKKMISSIKKYYTLSDRKKELVLELIELLAND